MNNMNMISFELTPYLAYALATNSLLSKDIDLAYERYKYKAYVAANNSIYYSSPLITDGNIKREVSAKRALGLIELRKIKDCNILDKSIFDLFKKGWSQLYSYILNTDVIDYFYVTDSIMENRHDDDYYVGFNVVLLFFSETLEKEITPIECRNDIAKLLHNYLNHMQNGERRFSFDFVQRDKELLEKAKSIKNRFLENFKIFNNVCDLNDSLIHDEELSDFCRSVSVIFDSENMLLSSMSDNAKILEKDILELAALYFIHNKNQNRVESFKFILFGLNLKYSIKSYKDIKTFYFKNNKETLFLELEKYEVNTKALKVDNLSLKRQIKALEHENNKLKKKYKESIEKENIMLKREIAKLENSLSKLKEDNENLQLLAQSFFDTNDDKKEIVLDERINVPNVKAVIAGGRSNWHDKIRINLPDSFTFIDGTNERFDEKILDNKEYVFIYTKYMSHGFYYKLIEKCKKLNTKVDYISSTSPLHLHKEIYEIIKSKKPTD
ncbi:hypothetical protein NE686_18285 [Tissierella carlieri]|uniref:DUF2325 domain-containing protein n=1 Tax=Tissierella carlieri TaxID=689904 RepID=A0ABT1SEZ3_9FIRM|nr:hypothetical protein [Tissierella carlieri]MCQ4925056.1 hypothetical protein [Tissierella carlieri]